MRGQLHSSNGTARTHSTSAQFAVAVVAVGALFGLLVAASASGVVVLFAAGAVTATVTRRVASRLADRRSLRVPGTTHRLTLSTA
jgi:uncharacterized membrane protein